MINRDKGWFLYFLGSWIILIQFVRNVFIFIINKRIFLIPSVHTWDYFFFWSTCVGLLSGSNCELHYWAMTCVSIYLDFGFTREILVGVMAIIRNCHRERSTY